MNGLLVRCGGLVRVGLLVLVVGLAVLSAAGAAPAEPAESYKLSTDGPLPIGGNVHGFKISPDGVYTVYLAGQDVVEVGQLYARRTDGSGSPTQLSALRGSIGSHVEEYAIGPDSNRLFYSADQDERDTRELYAVPLDGSTPPLKLSGEMVENGGLRQYSGGFKISPDGNTVVYNADQEIYEQFELYSVPADGSAPAKKLNGDLPDGGDTAGSYVITPDSQSLIYLADQETDDIRELYIVPLDGSAAPVKLNGSLMAGGSVSSFKMSADGSRVVYRAYLDTNNLEELYSVPLDGSAPPVKLNNSIVAGRNVGFNNSYAISPDSSRVIYIGDQDTDDVDELYSVPITGGTVVKLNPTLVSGGDVSWVWMAKITPDSSRVLYIADQDTDGVQELYSVPIGGGTAVKLNGPMTGIYLYDFDISPDSSHAVFRAQVTLPTKYELFSVPVAGGTPVLLNVPLSGGQVNNFRISPDSGRVVYQAATGSGTINEIYRVALTGGMSTKVNAPLVTDGSVNSYEIAPAGGRVVYIADQQVNNQYELFQAQQDAPGPVVKLNSTLAVGADIWDFRVTADSQYALYLADHDRLDFNDLYRVRTDGSEGPARLTQGMSGNPQLYELELTADSQWAVVNIRRTNQADTLSSIRIDGTVPPIQLNTTAVPSARVHYYRLSNDGKYIVYRAEMDKADVWELYSARVDGTGSQTKVNGPLVAGGVVQEYRISPDGTRVVYTADQTTDEVIELYSAPIGGGTSTWISGFLTAGGDVSVHNFDISPDGAWVAYVADKDTDDVDELYLTPIDGSASSIKINGSLVTGGDVQWFMFSPTGQYLAYYADQDVDEQYELYLFSLTNPAPPAKVNLPLAAGDNVYTFDFSPDEAYLAYMAGTSTDDQYDLYSVALPDGTPQKVNPTLGPGQTVSFSAFSPDSSYLAYSLFSKTNSTGALYNAAPDGSRPPTMINDPAGPGTWIGNYWFSSTGDRVLYQLGEVGGPNPYDVYSAAPDGSGPAIRVTGPMVAGGQISRVTLTPDDSRLIYSADQETDAVVELFGATLPPLGETEWRLYLPVVIR